MAPNGKPPGALHGDIGESAANWDPVRIQAAAVAAQQAALTEEEIKLAARRVALENQEEQLATHLEEKRQKLLQLSERAQAERTALEKERLAHEQTVGKITGDMTQAQREILKEQQNIEAERKRLKNLQRRLRQRWHRFWLAERLKLQRAQSAVAEQARSLEEQTEKLQDRDQDATAQRLRFNAFYELGRCRLREAWERLHQDQYRWKHRRGKERAALKRREHIVEADEQKIKNAESLLILEQRAWEAEKATLHTETAGLESRIRYQREKILAQQREITQLNADIHARAIGQEAAPDRRFNGEGLVYRIAADAGPERSPGQLAMQDAWQKRFLDLEKLAGELADQRVQLVEQWQRLGQLRDTWELDRRETNRELEDLVQHFLDNGRQLARREDGNQQADQLLRQRHEELLQIRQEMIAWRARLRLRETECAGERRRLLIEVKHREKLADQHLNVLMELRRRWSKRRIDELSAGRKERQLLVTNLRQNSQHRQELADLATALAEDKRIIAEKSLALEQHRQEILGKPVNAATERRLERLRRRWITFNAEAIRAAAKEKESVKTVIAVLEARLAELHARADLVAISEAELVESQTAWDHKQVLADARQSRLLQELQNAESQCKLADQQVARMKDEIERIAKSLIDQPDPPMSEVLSPAA